MDQSLLDDGGNAKIRVAFLARPTRGQFKRWIDEHSLQASWFALSEIDALPLRSAEVLHRIQSERLEGASLLRLVVQSEVRGRCSVVSIMKLSEHEYWHGTDAHAAVCIACEGFHIRPAFAKYGRGGLFREAIYLGKSLEVVQWYGAYIVRCALSQGTRILRLDGEYDQKCVAYLRREFGNKILTARFGVVLPANKHLTKKELISLLNFVSLKFKARDREWFSWIRNMTWVRDQLRRHKYHCLGDANDDDSGLAVIDPSRVNFVGLYKRRQPTRKKPEFGPLEPVDPDILASDVHQWLRDQARYAAEDPEYAREIQSATKRVCENLRTFQSRGTSVLRHG